MQTKDAE